LAAGSLVAAGTKDGSFTYTDGILNNHAYAVFGAYTLSNGARLIKISNPWGVDKYVGDYSDTSSKWTDALRKEVGSVNNENDGTFFIPVENFVADFSGFWFSKDISSWKKSSWLNIGKDIKSSSGGTAYFCKTTNCRANKFTLTSNDNQMMWVGIGTHDARSYAGCTMPAWGSNWKFAGISPGDTYWS
jgi:hypothetical protein